MNRREALLNGSAMVVSASLGAIACGAPSAVAQSAASAAAGSAGDGSVIDVAFDCQKKGEACVDHCVRMLVTGDTSMADCIVAVREMLPGTEALARLAATGSKHLPAAARLAIEVCEACEAACRKHAQVHAVCRECADSCARTIAACHKLVG
ncbi:MAG: four-helix bundle copper-binding protein [Polyangiaceae bacterium]|jgi:Cys-rich four helix bundle protein (predicted Tat secretion target)